MLFLPRQIQTNTALIRSLPHYLLVHLADVDFIARRPVQFPGIHPSCRLTKQHKRSKNFAKDKQPRLFETSTEADEM